MNHRDKINQQIALCNSALAILVGTVVALDAIGLVTWLVMVIA